jgi:predicted nucleic acid-binding protein
MSGNSFFLDTNILLYILNGDKVIKDKINNSKFYISFITELELLSFQNMLPIQENAIRSLIDDCIVVEYDSEVKENAIRLRRKHKMKLPDAIIAASAQKFVLPLVTADKSFSKIDEINIYLYQP